MTATSEPLWQRQAAQWSRIRPPLRPNDEDLSRSQQVVDGWTQSHPGEAPLVVILGATPELASLRFPPAAMLCRTDRALPMLQAHPGARPSLVQADWRVLPLDDAATDVVLGDGSLNAAPHATAAAIAAEMSRVLRPDGVFGVRVYVRPDRPASQEEVFAAAHQRRYSSFHIFKFHLLMALVDDAGDVAVADAWSAFASRWPSAAAMHSLAAEAGWPADDVRTIEAYAGQPDVYWFPTAGQFRAAVSDWFDEEACWWPGYEMGDRCPTLVLRPRPRRVTASG